MSKRIIFAMFMLSAMTLAACQNNDTENPNEEANQPNTEETQSNEPADNSTDNDNESEEEQAQKDTDKETTPSEDQASEENSSVVTEQNFDSEEEAVEAIENYREVDQTNSDLGYGIEGFIEGATGHQYISWNEGNWLIEIDFPLDPQYAVEEYDDGEAMAKAIVEYLEGQMLPPPDQRGVIRINGFNEHPETSIRWQKGKTVHEIYEEVSDPIDVLQIAVDYQNNK